MIFYFVSIIIYNSIQSIKFYNSIVIFIIYVIYYNIVINKMEISAISLVLQIQYSVDLFVQLIAAARVCKLI